MGSRTGAVSHMRSASPNSRCLSEKPHAELTQDDVGAGATELGFRQRDHRLIEVGRRDADLGRQKARQFAGHDADVARRLN